MKKPAQVIRRIRETAGRGARVAEILEFRRRVEHVADDCDHIDLLTAVDAAIRDLRDILARWGDETARLQAEECRLMLEQAYAAAN